MYYKNIPKSLEKPSFETVINFANQEHEVHEEGVTTMDECVAIPPPPPPTTTTEATTTPKPGKSLFYRRRILLVTKSFFLQ